jgi:hypothetical protein
MFAIGLPEEGLPVLLRISGAGNENNRSTIYPKRNLSFIVTVWYDRGWILSHISLRFNHGRRKLFFQSKFLY